MYKLFFAYWYNCQFRQYISAANMKMFFRVRKEQIMQGVIKRCCLSWLTNSALVYEPKCEGRGGVAGSQSMSTAVHRSQNKLWISNSILNLYVLVLPVNNLTSSSEVFNDLGVVGTHWPGEGSQVDTL
jgi:hypothetical protein